MADPIELLHKAKLEKFHNIAEIKSKSSLSPEELIKSLPALDIRYINIDTSSLTSLCATNERIIYGTTNGSLHAFNYTNEQTHTYKPSKKVSSAVTCLDIYINNHNSLAQGLENSSFLIVGYASGHISLYDLKNSKLLHTILLYKTPILGIKFAKNIDRVVILSEDFKIVSFKKKLMKYRMKQIPVPCFDEKIVFFDVLKDQNIEEIYVVILSFNRLMIFIVGNTVPSFDIYSLNPKEIPYMAYRAGEVGYVIAISYGNVVAVYNVLKEGLNASLCFDTTQDICGLNG